ncbi:hypothetical protein D3C78_1524850 [compost metagenome]
MIAVERLIQLTQRLDDVFVIGAQHDTLRAHTIGNSSPFLEELRVGDDIKRQVAAALAQRFSHHFTNFISGTYRYG